MTCLRDSEWEMWVATQLGGVLKLHTVLLVTPFRGLVEDTAALSFLGEPLLS